LPQYDGVPDDYHMKVSRIPWDPEQYKLSGMDYIFGIILETPEMYMITPNRKLAYVYTINRGMIAFSHDFTWMSDEQADRLIYYLRRDFG
jgi:hypothetical protein